MLLGRSSLGSRGALFETLDRLANSCLAAVSESKADMSVSITKREMDSKQHRSFLTAGYVNLEYLCSLHKPEGDVNSCY
jgi:hypothetical protein